MNTAVAAAPAPVLRNLTFDELNVADSASLVRIVGRDDIDLFAAVSGDVNPAHLDATFAATDLFGHVVAHGMWTAALVSAVLGTKLPGPGTIYIGQELKFLKPVAPGDTITVTVRVKEKRAEKHIILLETSCTNQSGKEVLSGTATVIAPANKIEWPRSTLPQIKLRRQDRYEAFVKKARSLPPLRAAIVHPCSAEAILGALEVQREGLLDPLLIGPEPKIRAAAEQAQVALEGIPIEPASHSHAAAAHAHQSAGSSRSKMSGRWPQASSAILLATSPVAYVTSMLDIM
jgi:phosphate acetyltransferase